MHRELAYCIISHFLFRASVARLPFFWRTEYKQVLISSTKHCFSSFSDCKNDGVKEYERLFRELSQSLYALKSKNLLKTSSAKLYTELHRCKEIIHGCSAYTRVVSFYTGGRPIQVILNFW